MVKGKVSGYGVAEEFINVIKPTLKAALCTSNFSSMLVERHNSPQIEEDHYHQELILQPVTICRSEHQKIHIEPSINSDRISFKIMQVNDTDKMIARHFVTFMTRRANDFKILRRVTAHEGYDITFLITNFHLEEMVKDKLIE